jgi:hypothetical protein
MSVISTITGTNPLTLTKRIALKEHTLILAQLSCALCLLLGLACSCQSSPDPSTTKVRISPRLPEEQIRAEILKYTPVGSSADEVLSFARTRLKHAQIEPDAISPNPVIRHFYGLPKKHPEVIGKRSITVLLGRYGFNPLARRDVYIGWAFDEGDKLIDVAVEKGRDSL